MNEAPIKTLEEEVWEYVSTLRNSPEARMKSRELFYKKFGQENSSGQFGYGDSEISFLGWEVRSVLQPPDATPPGSAWWSHVNLWFIFLSELGARAYELGFSKPKLPIAAQFWIGFIETPSPASWYRAHNSSIIDGYLKYPDLAELETMPEKLFINMVLYRLLYAQSMVEGEFVFPKLGKILGDPRGGAVKFITSLDAYYPDHYPMTKEEINDILGKTHSLDEIGVKILDDVLIETELTTLYAHASEWNRQPLLKQLISTDKPCYPNNTILPDTQKSWLIRLLLWLRKVLFSKN